MQATPLFALILLISGAAAPVLPVLLLTVYPCPTLLYLSQLSSSKPAPVSPSSYLVSPSCYRAVRHFRPLLSASYSFFAPLPSSCLAPVASSQTLLAPSFSPCFFPNLPSSTSPVSPLPPFPVRLFAAFLPLSSHRHARLHRFPSLLPVKSRQSVPTGRSLLAPSVPFLVLPATPQLRPPCGSS